MIDLFAGTGAFTKAFEETGKVQCVFANDVNQWSKELYEANHGKGHFRLDDIHDVVTDDIPRHDILTAGFPCQPFSIAGNRAGFDDKRSNVFWKMLDIITKHEPEAVVLENVKNLKTHNEGKTYNVIKNSLEERGYYVKSEVLDTSKVSSIPQHRERIYIVAVRDKNIYDKMDLNFPTIHTQSVENMLEKEEVKDKYYYTSKSSPWDLLSENVVKRNTVYQYRRVYVRENKSGVCPTLTANMGTGGHNVPIILDERGIRKLTPRECFNFQGFGNDYILPKTISDTQLYKLSGNAVSLPVVKLIAKRLCEYI